MKNFFLLIISFIFSVNIYSQNEYNILNEQKFKDPPSWAKPKTLLHVMSGNLSKEGMKKDLKAIYDAGIGGVMLFDVGQSIPYGPIKYNSKEHHEILKYAAKECEKLGLSFGFHNCAGWSSSGGPWILPDESMKMVVNSEIVVDGGRVNIQLPQPTKREGFYRDIAVLAYPSLSGEITDYYIKPTITSSDPNFNLSIACNGRVDSISTLKKIAKKEAYVLFEYPQVTTISSVYMSTQNRNGEISLFVSNDGINYRKITDLTNVRVGKNEWSFQNSFEPVKGKFFKLVANSSLTIYDIKLSSTRTIDDYLTKNCMNRSNMDKLKDVSYISKDNIIKKESIVDLTSSFIDGKLITNLPNGKWTVLRIGYTATGATNHPAPISGKGLECDKFSQSALDKHFNSFSKRVIDNTKSVAPNALQYIEIDSYEMGGQNWTEGFESIFKEKEGYNLRRFLPIVLGKYVDDINTSESVLYDFRKTCCDLMKTNYYSHFTKLCHDNGVESYIEPYGNGPISQLSVGGVCDVPMGEFWVNRSLPLLRPASSSGHIYGKRFISAESFTSNPQVNWRGNPALAKADGDLAFINGVNRFVLHRFAHQANTHVKPGMTMGQWGFHFDRTQTWWDNAGKAFFKYLSRGSYMLSLGVPVSDMLILATDDTPSSIVDNDYFGIKYDVVNSDVLINRVSTKNGNMLLPEGTTYKMLYLERCNKMKIETLKRICELSKSGVLIIGDLPVQILGFKQNKSNIDEFNSYISQLKASTNYYPKEGFHKAICNRNITKDLYLENKDSINIEYTHRHLTNGTDIYFISNQEKKSHNLICNFRISGKLPELWNPMNGNITSASIYEIEDNGRTRVNIKLEPEESMFVIFKDETTELKSNKLCQNNTIHKENLNDDWKVKFQKEYGYNKSVAFDCLYDWSKSENDNIKFYSGTATYSKIIEISSDILEKSNRAVLNLGEVFICAEVYVNNKYVGIRWITPFTFDIYKYLKKGKNKIDIKITNQWTNRLIGDERYPLQDGGYKGNEMTPKSSMPEWYIKNKKMPKGKRITFCAHKFYDAKSPLINAGMVGPVFILFSEADDF